MTLQELQTLLKKHKYDAYLIKKGNCFIDEDILPEENKILELTGFTGSDGLLVVTPNKAALIVDGRYTLQARQQVDTRLIELPEHKFALLDTAFGWLEKKLDPGSVVAFDAWTFSVDKMRLQNHFATNFKLISDPHHLLGNLLSEKHVNVFKHEIEFAGISSEEKISLLLQNLKAYSADAYLVSSAAEVSWLLNLRSDALPDTPVFRAYALINANGDATVFGNYPNKENIHSFEELPNFLKAFKSGRLLIDENTCPQKILEFIPKSTEILKYASLLERALIKKNPVEIEGFRKAHLRDGVAVTKFLYWLENNWRGLSELDVVNKLRSFREENDNFYGDSFPTIAGIGANGAIVHYQPDVKTNQPLIENTLLLIDSGAQYFDGTTDITRTIALGNVSAEMVNNATAVLKAHIDIAGTQFPHHTKGCALDAVGRRNLWNIGKDYEHGTGHGVGCFSKVHEGHVRLSPQCLLTIPLHMVTSIEPGFYKNGEYGIRIENLALVTEVESENLQKPLYKFETLTLAPIDKRLINKYLLSKMQIAWLNNYHQTVFEKLSPFMTEEENRWLENACTPL